ncbi:hypothetical protein LDENG_00219540 [Lucifuga dentata]|nr:hypothetical protein LDENG_00219540 [Lucifuga dentata]
MLCEIHPVMINWKLSLTSTELCVNEEQQASLQDILRYSPFNTEEELLIEVNAISSSSPSTDSTGTRIIIWNLRKTSTGTTEFDFETDRYDIRIPSEVYKTMSETSQHPEGVTPYVPESEYSLRAYCSILYLKPRMLVIVRGQIVKTQLVSKSLAYIKKDHYKPISLNKRIPITFGYNTKSKDQYGIMMYHKNRLIKAYERVGCQLKANFQGRGVIGIIECNFMDPTHNKQSFSDSDKYRKTISSLGHKLEDYWKEIRHRRNQEDPNNSIPVEDTMKRPDQNWVQCNNCLKWRKLPDGIDCDKLPEKWFCYKNPDPQFRSCQVEEEPEDSDDEEPSYRKTYKQHEREGKKNEERKKKMLEEDQKRREEEQKARLVLENEKLRKQQEKLIKQLRRTSSNAPVQSPATPDTPRSRRNCVAVLAGGSVSTESTPLRSSRVSQAACKRSSESSLMISEVWSLSATPQRMERTPSVTPESTPKRLRMNGFHRTTSETPSSWDPSSSPVSINPPDSSDNTSDIDDNIVILETDSPPVSKKSDFDLTKVKPEPQQSDPDLMMECISDDDAANVAPETNAAGSSATASAAVGAKPSTAPGLANSVTQTEVPKIKDEEEEEQKRKERQDEHQTEEGEGTVPKIEKVNGNAMSSDAITNVCSMEQGDIKEESTEDTNTPGKQTFVKGVVHQLDLLHSMNEAQEHQDRLLELMQAAAQERDAFKDQVAQLTSQLHDAQTRLQELSQPSVKKECVHQTSQTEEAEEEQDYKRLFEQARQKVDDLIKDKEALLAAFEAKPSTAHDEENEIKHEIDEIALQVDSLVRELDKRNKQRDELLTQLECLEKEKANLVSQCEELMLRLQQQRTHTETHTEDRCSASQSSSAAHVVKQEADKMEDSDPASSSDASRSLIELRQNVGRLLAYFMPALDLDQVNYRCNVLDEMLEQVLSNEESLMTIGLKREARNE